MEEIKVGEYVRTLNGEIFKIKKYPKEQETFQTEFSDWLDKNIIVKHKEKLIDLIEVGDYVNGKEIIEVRKQNEKIYLMTEYVPQSYIKDEIKSIVTKEQFKQVKYEV